MAPAEESRWQPNATRGDQAGEPANRGRSPPACDKNDVALIGLIRQTPAHFRLRVAASIKPLLVQSALGTQHPASFLLPSLSAHLVAVQLRMGTSDEVVTPVATSLDNSGSDIIQVQNADELRLAQMGVFVQYKSSLHAR